MSFDEFMYTLPLGIISQVGYSCISELEKSELIVI